MGQYHTVFKEKKAGYVYPYLTCQIHSVNPTHFYHKWRGFIPEDNMRNGLLHCMIEYKKARPRYGNLPWISDLSELDKFDAKVTTWLHREWVAKLCEESVPFYAFVMPQEMFFRAEIEQYKKSIEQMNCNLKVHSFNNISRAIDWLTLNSVTKLPLPK